MGALLLGGGAVLPLTRPGAARGGTDAALASLPGAYPAGTRPGPSVLYAPPPDAPQLDSYDAAHFTAPPLLVSGTEAYASGEYLYQGYLYADHGGGNAGSGPSNYGGALTYPMNAARYGNNAANIVELRISTLDSANVLYRFTLNTLLAPDTSIVTLAFDTDGNRSTGCARLPHDPMQAGHDGFAGTDQVVTTWGTGADLGVCHNGSWTVTPLTVDENMTARQLTVTVPRSLSDPHATWRATLAAGLYDGHGGWLQPQQTADATHPGGAGTTGPHNAIFDLGFRFDEPASSSTTLPLFPGVGDGPDQRQAAALLADDPEAFQHPIDFSALDQGTVRSTVPAYGVQVRIFASRLDLGQGVDGTGHELGQLEPYVVSIPEAYRPGTPMPFMMALHSATDHYWQYVGSQGLRDWTDGHDEVVAVPEGYGTDLFWGAGRVATVPDSRIAEYDVFEVWNDVARHFSLDPDRTVLYGYSMGGVGTQWICSLYPDLCGKAYEVVGGTYTTQWVPPFQENTKWDDDLMLWLENVRNVPLLEGYDGEGEYSDEIVQAAQNLTPQVPFENPGLQELGYRYDEAFYPVGEHLTIAGAGYRIPLEVPFLDDTLVDRSPAHVTFSYLPVTDDVALGLVHDHAYWVSGVTLYGPHMNPPLLGSSVDSASGGALEDANAAGKAAVDAVSSGLGQGDPTTSPIAGTGVGPAFLPYVEYGQRWSAPPTRPPANHLSVALTNVRTVTFDVAAAALDATHRLDVGLSTSTPTLITLAGTFPSGATATVDGKPAAITQSGSGLTVDVPEGAHTVVVDPPAPAGPGQPPVSAGSAPPTPLDRGDLSDNGCTAEAGATCQFVADDAFLAQGYLAAVNAGTSYKVIDDTTGQTVVNGTSTAVATAPMTPYHRFTLVVSGGGGVVYAGDVTLPQPRVGS
ncbi:MAG TPA: hypothetical protein VGR90_05270 [Acidimicrobiales bacterium]|nr:hypothetical protein [Acidimicrobiales bacterium]